MRLGPLDYLGRLAFTQENFPDIWFPVTAITVIFLIATVVLYNVQVRRLHRHEPLRAMQEWLLWTGLITFGFILTGIVFNFYFLFILLAIVIGCATFVWIRFFRFPPYIQAYNDQLRRARFFSQSKYKAAEATVRSRRARGSQRRRR